MTTTKSAETLSRKAFRLEVKEIDGEKGVFEGYGNTFGLVDSYREVVEQGAFKKTLKDKAGQKIKLLWQHDPSQPIGTLEAVEDEYGLKVRASLTLGVQKADEAYLLLKSGAIDAMSIGFDVQKEKIDKSTGIRHLLEIRLWEVSLVTFPANSASLVEAVKADDPAALETKEGRTISKATQTKLATALDQITSAAKAIAALLGDDEDVPETAAKSIDPATLPEPDATGAANTGTPADAKSHDRAGNEGHDAHSDEVAAIAQQIKADAERYEAQQMARDLLAAMQSA